MDFTERKWDTLWEPFSFSDKFSHLGVYDKKVNRK